MKKVTIRDIMKKYKNGEKIVMVTAYDYPFAKLVDEAGVDMILVGDSLGMVVLGYPSTNQVTMKDMLHHVAAVARANPKAMIVGDMPFGSYEVSEEEAVRNAVELVRAGAEAVKLEGGKEVADKVEAIVKAGIPVMGHLGLTPQKRHALGGYRLRGKTEEEARELLEDAKALEEAGVFSIVLEFVKAEVAKKITEEVGVPTICIGAGPWCSGQVLVIHDILGLAPFSPPFAKKYFDCGKAIVEAVKKFAEEVRSGEFPGEGYYW
ncbi:3-methyl-2-oxobutanoate hydroxymethyltransferase [Ignicoccus hospitalis]|uniref:3-methyl-2-oxobutanoate hydroxymethyltransferase n=1 Tax=Ignicoccus hospitalis (strain KIN4/I / DSM 18386 / JCM 14125) TaxID=453591 RepID=PANB_IGNH4|nr:3-methyl-2-oxobutanoate hydroxymethyltransferase [Ignicoccus hospitalis]A8A9H3.1 RecName: Full=3-methyl-2-oxobutanoate hydroxymethyltransferase; AltName: Full=Ketopantoate hydroxymethyltransferase; Short=KPHMT [Ignicoccus hospitalis KIN4/I]ABU81575.1 3-methyl-2-oxobutanoate hydroxymethyltransferase [Ignicoccus hospitalis KIN4/I]HIH90510.1 3-methyl-2-oxobutanoate hydroxymethyltransferase [Desulfurococcaceae archaeon]